MTRSPSDLLDPPILDRIRGLSLVARRVTDGVLHGLHRSRHRGLSTDFAQHRAYTPGDELKHLDWQVLARSDRLVVKQYQQETNLRALLFLDCSASMNYAGTPNPPASNGAPKHGMAFLGQTVVPTKFTYAQRLAACLAHLMLHQGDSVGLSLLRDDNVDQQLPGAGVAPRASPGHILSICHALINASPAGTTNLPGALMRLASRLKRRSVIILISDLLDDPQAVLASLGRLHHRGHEVIIFQVLDPRELDFNFDNQPGGITVIRDMETGSEFEAEPHLIRRMVQQQIQNFCDTLDAGTRSRGLHLLRCSTNTDLGLMLSRYLHHRFSGTGGRA
ncbi:MAG: DUF58 domain-containing protein [Phycisphaerales bacterium]